MWTYYRVYAGNNTYKDFSDYPEARTYAEKIGSEVFARVGNYADSAS